MHDHDSDLIAAAAEGSLGAEVEATLAACPTCMEELALQREALAALAAAPVPLLTEMERARLHRTVLEAVAPRRPSPAVPWYQRLVPVMAAAAALLVVVGLGSVLLGGSGDSSAKRSVLTDGEAGSVSQLDAADEAARETTAAGAADTTTTIAQPLAAAEAPAPTPTLDFGAVTAEELRDRARTYLADGFFTAGPSEAVLEDTSPEADMRCRPAAVAEAGGDDPVGSARATVDGVDVEVYFFSDAALVFDASTCTLTTTID